jgi:hypothetical protein
VRGACRPRSRSISPRRSGWVQSQDRVDIRAPGNAAEADRGGSVHEFPQGLDRPAAVEFVAARIRWLDTTPDFRPELRHRRRRRRRRTEVDPMSSIRALMSPRAARRPAPKAPG